MDTLLKRIIEAAGISGFENEIAKLMQKELQKVCGVARRDSFGNVIAKKGEGKKKLMLTAHMDEVGLLVKNISKEGFISFIKVGGIDDRILPAQKVLIKSKKGDVFGIIGSKPPHVQKEEEKKAAVKYEDMFIDIGAVSKEDAEKKVSVGDAVIFEPHSGVLSGRFCYGKAIDNRVGCYVLLKIMEKLKAKAEVYAVASVQEEVGLKGAKASSFSINPDFALVIDTSVAGDSPALKERDSSLKLGAGVGITLIEAGGRGFIVNEKVKDLLLGLARTHQIKHQIDIIEGGMTDAAMIYMNREGILTGVLTVPTRYVHAPTGVFSLDDVEAAITLGVKAIESIAE